MGIIFFICLSTSVCNTADTHTHTQERTQDFIKRSRLLCFLCEIRSRVVSRGHSGLMFASRLQLENNSGCSRTEALSAALNWEYIFIYQYRPTFKYTSAGDVCRCTIWHNEPGKSWIIFSENFVVCGRRPLINAAILSSLPPAFCLEVHYRFSCEHPEKKKKTCTIKYVHTSGPLLPLTSRQRCCH